VSWQDQDHLDESWLPSWGGDEAVVPPQDPPEPPAESPEAPAERPPEPDAHWVRATDVPEFRVNLALWWFALLSEGPPPSGDWVEHRDELDWDQWLDDLRERDGDVDAP
jgi:hypothetical protein